MKLKKQLESQVNWEHLKKVLSKSPSVQQQSSDKDDIASELVHHLSDIEASCLNLVNEILPRLTKKDAIMSEEEIEDTLLDIGEELRHILYHIENNKYYSYLKDSV